MEHLFAVQALSELTDVMPDAGGSVFVAGHSLPGDGGGGMFQWIAESTEPHDGGVVIAGDNQVGRWHRVEAQPVNVKWFGAMGDGADATDAIQRALDVAKSGGTVRIPSGKWLIRKPLQIHQGTTLTGDGLLTVLQYAGPEKSGCVRSATPDVSCAFQISRINFEVLTKGAWAIDLRGMSFSRFDHIFMHLRRHECSGFYGPGDTRSPYYNVFTGCHVSGPGHEDSNGCIAFNFAFDTGKQDQSANANQILGGHINSVETALICHGTGNVFYGQVMEQCRNGYVFDLPPSRYDAASKGTVNTIAGCYTEYVKRVIVQKHETCIVTAELTHTTGYEIVFDAQDTKHSVVLTSHDGRLEASRSLIHRRIDLQID